MEYLLTILSHLAGFAFNFFVNCTVFAFHFPKRERFWFGFISMTLLYVVLFLFIPGESFFQEVMKIGNFTWYFIFPFTFQLLTMYFCFKISITDALFIALAGWLGENIVSSLSCDFALLCGFTIRSTEHYLIRLGLIFLFEVLYSVLINHKMKQIDNIQAKQGTTIVLALFGVAFLTGLAQVKSGFSIMQEKPVAMMLYTYSGVLSIVFLCLMLGISDAWQLSKDNARLEGALHKQAEMYKQNKENIDLINIKCHDLSKEIALIGQMNLQEEDKAILASVKDKINIYGNTIKTGNESLDLIFANKSLQIEQNQIKLTCMADGLLLSFMPGLDIFSLFGNALDNAIESVLQEDIDKRIISFKLYKKDDFLLFELTNYCSHLDKIDQNPSTTKKDKEYHGYGIKAIKYIVNKYHGTTKIGLEDKLFSLVVLIPMND